MTDQRQHHLTTTEDLAGRGAAGRGAAEHRPDVHDLAGQDLSRRQPNEYEPVERGLGDPKPADYDAIEHADREPVEQTPADRDVAEPDLTDQERADHEPVPQQPQEPRELHAVTATPGDAPLFTADDSADYQAEWRALQADFVDDPREAVQRADELVAQVMQNLATTFTEHKHALEEQWQRGDEVQTEELRQALKRYRSFFDRLLSV